MAKALGLIGNFKGKLGNTVGYSLKDSNNKQTQGVRVYQPVVRNPKTAAQAEQRAKLAPINATYRALKMVIDRGQEGKAYGNKSRLAWLSSALKSFNGSWIERGATTMFPAFVPLTKGSIGNPFIVGEGDATMQFTDHFTGETVPANIGELSTLLLTQFSSLKKGDQITVVQLSNETHDMQAFVVSFIISPDSDDELPFQLVKVNTNLVVRIENSELTAGAFIVSREGDGGQHLRTNSNLVRMNGTPSSMTGSEAKQAAIESYMSQGANTDWAEESLM